VKKPPSEAQHNALLGLLEIYPKERTFHCTLQKNLIARGWVRLLNLNLPKGGVVLTDAGRNLAEELRAEEVTRGAQYILDQANRPAPSPSKPPTPLTWRERMLAEPKPAHYPRCGHLVSSCPECENFWEVHTELVLQVTLLQQEKQRLELELTRAREVARTLVQVIQTFVQDPG
jgi:hypothetical protein